MKIVRAEIVATGLVQGVGFRYFVFREAEKLKVAGFVKNLYDGNVFVVAEGEQNQVEELIGKIKIGPMHAHIKKVHVKFTIPQNDFTRFEINY